MTLFSAPPWNFFKKCPHILAPDKTGLYTLSLYDPFFIRPVRAGLSRNETGPKLKFIEGKEVTLDWLEHNLFSLSLFGPESYFIVGAEDVPKEVQEKLLSEFQSMTAPYFILCFFKDVPFLKSLQKVEEATHLMIEPPKFWEGRRLLEYLVEEMRLKISASGMDLLVGSVENTALAFYQALNFLRLVYPDGLEISEAQVKEIIGQSRLDVFAMSALFSRKDFAGFFNKALSLRGDFEAMKGLALFMQSHLLKLANPQYAEKKKRPSQYDKEILERSRSWNETDIRKYMRLFSEIELLAKQKGPWLWTLLQTEELDSLKKKSLPK